MSWLHCFWGVGTIISPFVMSYALINSGWNSGYRIISFIQLGIALILLLSTPLWKSNENAESDQSSTSKSIGIIEALKIKGVPSLLLGFFAYCAAESTAMAWSCTYFVEAKNIDEPTAAAFASSFFIGMTVGRFLGGFIMDRLGDRKMIVLDTAIAFCGVLCLLIPTGNEKFAVAGFIIIGLGFAPIYPCIIHATPNNFGAENSGAIIGIQMASAYVGSTFMPPVYGLLGKWLGYGMMPIYILLFMALMICMSEKTFRITK